MKKEILHKKLSRYLEGEAKPAETRQIQNWLALVDKTTTVASEQEKHQIGEEILNEIKAETAYPLLYPQQKSWWDQLTDRFK
ncbi:MAG: hypothetical protein ABS85_14255 [Sphingobacteriales bacterium SCN 48-20]|jgi:hypothetical protein|uniref:hypothetical protein n=1 Tax=Terrimonas ferruginea TaxID=249 RepID=UPI000869111D|nr:hypothetical protein [Terrimonas ferruginea]MBN8781794.1 hypothetical protein [Terrimonas ferruginea]ODT90866.1 MAG: hypothetical protein ABS85_14255 [Sphingobacteriales bacterium SCN 48-20]OJW44941.1 MAG: hypothetical protein BGO56_15965 [Sphingobacteriales bacterium 48-107]